jgi:Kdo2-lipid IVA lauroyltransferase/acyltransferase
MALVRLISRLPFGMLYMLSDFLFFVTFYVVKYRRKIVWKNLTRSFPEKSESDLRKIEKEFYKNLADYAVEMLKLLTISKEELGKRMVFTNPELVSNYISKGQSLLHLASHHFNWEWLLTTGSFVLAGEMDFVYQPVHNEFFNKFSLQSRTRFGAHAITRDSVAREIIKRKSIVRNVALVGDQYPGYGHDKKFQITFLNQDTVFFLGTMQLAILTQYPVIYQALRKVKRGHYEVTMIELATPPYPKDSREAIVNYARQIELLIRERPAEWLWSHNRWKTRHLEENP